tara:strand:- start:150 stop:1007 length:858 start_codon:yes stop_codon:yes gene_type:complete
MKSQLRETVQILVLFTSAVTVSGTQTTEELLAQAQAASRAGFKNQALQLLNQAIQASGNNPKAYIFRGILLSKSGQSEASVSDYTRALQLDPKLNQAYDLRGQEHFKLTHIEKAIRDFDKAIELQPSLEPYHWQRGIALYYGRRYQEARRQFKLHQLVNPNDVENAVWHFLCVSKLEGIRKARQRMISIQDDWRVPMMELYELFRGGGTIEKVIQATLAGTPPPAELNQRLFYRDLYLGLYHEALGNRKKALDYIKRAAHDYSAVNYMGEVARVHLRLLEASNIQ